MADEVEFRVVDGAPQTTLCRTFNARADEVFDAWTKPAIVARWWGPHAVEVVECHFDLREGGQYRITMRTADGRLYPMHGTVHDVVARQAFSLVVQLDEHPDDWLEMFRPSGTELHGVPMEWYYQISFRQRRAKTMVEVLATYPVLEDRDAMVSMHGEVGWAESFEKLDALLAAGS